jgi:PAS domain S-box-containing protein
LPLVCLVLAFLFIIANGALAVVALRDLNVANTKVQRALEAMLLLKVVEDYAEGGRWDYDVYRLTGQTQYLDAYRRAQLELPAAIDRLRDLIGRNKEQLVSLDRLTTSISQNMPEPTAIAAAPPSATDGAVQDRLAANAQWATTVVAAVNDMVENEQELLRDRLAVIRSRNAVMLGTTMLGTIGSVGLIGTVFLLMRRDARRSEELAAAHSGALQESELRFRHIFEESPLGILLAQRDSQRIVQANPAFCRMLGYPADEIAGKTIPEITHLDDRDLLIDAARRTADPEHVIETRYVTHSGSVTWAQVRLAQLSTPDGRQALLLVLAEDITREKQAQAELRQAQKMEAIGQLTGGIAHDFNNLLGVIIGNVEFLLDALPDKPEHAEMAREILNSALSGADLTRRLLAFARRQTLQPRMINLNAHLPNHLGILRRLLGETVQITTTLASDLWPTRVDPSQVGDALLNLAINARDAMPHGGSIAIETTNVRIDAATAAEDGDMTPGDYIVLSVTDTGTGMPPELLERAVEPFFTTKPPGAGSGLGLSMIYGFAKQSGGQLRIQSEPGHGTVVRLYLPRAQREEADCDEVADDASLPRGSEVILLVDDNAEMRAVGRRHLESLGYAVAEADSGTVALELLQGQDRYDLLFTDIVMPAGITGYQLAAAARRLRPTIKVLFTSGFAGPGTENDPVRPLLCKPYRKQELAIAVRAALAR